MANPDRNPRPESNRPPRRRRGGHELPDSVQDRPEQNAGYDEAVRGRSAAPPAEQDVTTQDERVDDSFLDEEFVDDDAHHFGDLAESDEGDEPAGNRRR